MIKHSITRVCVFAFALIAIVVAGFAGSPPAVRAEESGPALPANEFHTVPVRTGFPLAVGEPDDLLTLVGWNVNVTRKSAAQSETTVAVDPTNWRHLLVASNDLGDTAHIYESFNLGRTWREAGLGLGSLFCYDPWLDFAADGTAFFAYECSDQRIAYRRPGQATWTKTRLNNAGGFPDRSMVVVDTTPASPFFNSVYIGYDDNAASNTAYLLYSRDGLGQWTRTPKINDVSLTIGVNAAVAPDGTVYAVWEDFNNRRILVDRSTNGGATWGTDRVVHNYRLNTPSFFISIPPQPDRGIVPMPFSDTAPTGTTYAGRLYVTYTDKGTSGSATNIYVRFSDDGGQTWSAEAKVNDGTTNAYHFHPSITVLGNGTVAVSFYSTRDDQPANRKTHQYIAFSTDGSTTWSANVRVTTGQSDESGYGDPNDYGDYQGLDAGPTGLLSQVWTDSRPGGTIGEDMASAPLKP